MLQFLLDEQISPDVAEGLRRKSRHIVVWSVGEWAEGRFLGVADELCLEAAAKQRLTLVTYDRKTIPPLLKAWAEEGRDHAGVVFVDREAIPSSDFGGLIRALHRLWEEADGWDWTSRIVTLGR